MRSQLHLPTNNTDEAIMTPLVDGEDNTDTVPLLLLLDGNGDKATLIQQ